MIEAGRIVACLCATYGWTPDYCLWNLSWAQVLMYHAYAMEIQHPGILAPAPNDDNPEPSAGDGPDVEAIEQRYGDRIKRVTDGR